MDEWAQLLPGISYQRTCPDLPAGPDVGIASVGFTPPGFIGRGGTAYVAGTDALGARLE